MNKKKPQTVIQKRGATGLSGKRKRKIRYLDGVSKFYQGYGKTVGRHVGEIAQCEVLSQENILSEEIAQSFALTVETQLCLTYM